MTAFPHRAKSGADEMHSSNRCRVPQSTAPACQPASESQDKATAALGLPRNRLPTLAPRQPMPVGAGEPRNGPPAAVAPFNDCEYNELSLWHVPIADPAAGSC